MVRDFGDLAAGGAVEGVAGVCGGCGQQRVQRQRQRQRQVEDSFADQAGPPRIQHPAGRAAHLSDHHRFEVCGHADTLWTVVNALAHARSVPTPSGVSPRRRRPHRHLAVDHRICEQRTRAALGEQTFVTLFDEGAGAPEQPGHRLHTRQ
ncbi:hypothetical protein AB0L00_44170 [Actinoallomurus sp. NPDC052308]|uniref:hypothetical protein n=1 Tax=Actinoallomurus sp. NPDC052308 TaxID=3155530 RepID=UPI0034195926